MIESIINIFNYLYEIVKSECFANVISLLELVIAIIALIIGGRKVSELFEEFAKRKREAIFGYYTNINHYIKRIVPLISDNNEKHLGTLFLLSANEDLRKANSGLNIIGKKLSMVANECLQYLSAESMQVPIANTNEERLEWKAKIDNLIDILNQFFLIGSEIYIPSLSDEKAVELHYEEVKKLLDNIQESIENETNIFFNMVESQSKN